MVKCGVLFDVWTEFLNIIYMSFGFKGLIQELKHRLCIDTASYSEYKSRPSQ
jgi:hypothetical protein